MRAGRIWILREQAGRDGANRTGVFFVHGAPRVPGHTGKGHEADAFGEADLRKLLGIVEGLHLLCNQTIAGFAFSTEEVVVNVVGGLVVLEFAKRLCGGHHDGNALVGERVLEFRDGLGGVHLSERHGCGDADVGAAVDEAIFGDFAREVIAAQQAEGAGPAGAIGDPGGEDGVHENVPGFVRVTIDIRIDLRAGRDGAGAGQQNAGDELEGPSQTLSSGELLGCF